MLRALGAHRDRVVVVNPSSGDRIGFSNGVLKQCCLTKTFSATRFEPGAITEAFSTGGSARAQGVLAEPCYALGHDVGRVRREH